MYSYGIIQKFFTNLHSVGHQLLQSAVNFIKDKENDRKKNCITLLNELPEDEISLGFYFSHH